MTTYRRPGGSNWRRAGRGIVPTQEPWQQPQPKPGMVTGQQPQAAQPTLLDKKLNPAKYPTLETSPGVQKTNFGFPPLRGDDPKFDAGVQKRRADAFAAARKARLDEFNASGAGVAAQEKTKDFIDKLRGTKVDPKTFTGVTKTKDHPLYESDIGGGPGKDERELYTGMYSPAWHHGQQNIQKAARLEEGNRTGKIMRPQPVGPAGTTGGGNFRKPANQWALGNIKIRTENALKAGFRPIMGQVRDGTGRMVEDIVGYEKESDALKREALKMKPEEAVGIQKDPQDNPFIRSAPELPGIDNAGPDIELTPPMGAPGWNMGETLEEPGGSSDNLDIPLFDPETYDVDPSGTVSAPSDGVERVSPFGEEPSDVGLGGRRGMMIPDLQNVTEPSQDLPPRLDPESERSNAEIFSGTNRPQPPNEFTPVPQSPNSTGAQDFTGPYTDEDPGLPDQVGPAPDEGYEVEENPFDIQEGMQNPYSPDYDPSGVAPAQGEVQEPSTENPFEIQQKEQNDMAGVGAKLRENQDEIDDTQPFGSSPDFPKGYGISNPDHPDYNPELDKRTDKPVPTAPPSPGTALEDLPALPESERPEYDIDDREKELEDTGSFEPVHEVPPGVEFNDPKDRMPPMDFDDTSAPEIAGGPETFPEVPAMPMTPDGTLGPLPPIGSQEEADIANPQSDLSGNFPTSGVELPPIGSQEEADIANPQSDLSGNFPASPIPAVTPDGSLVGPRGDMIHDTQTQPGVEDFFSSGGLQEFPEYDIDDIGGTELPPYESRDLDLQLEEAPAAPAAPGEPALSPEGQEQANALMMQMDDMPEGPELDALILQYEELLKQDRNRLAPAAPQASWDQRGD